VYSVDKLRGLGKVDKKAPEAFNGGGFRSGAVVAQPNHRAASITRTISKLRGVKSIPAATQNLTDSWEVPEFLPAVTIKIKSSGM
jgi:hypothetical protein